MANQRPLPTSMSLNELQRFANRVWDAIDNQGTINNNTVSGNSNVRLSNGGSIPLSSSSQVITHSQIIGRELPNQHPGTAISNTPYGTISSTNVQSAINQIEDQKRNILDATITTGSIFTANQPFRLIEGIATVITSLDVNAPFVDGVILDAGVPDASRQSAMTVGNKYTTLVMLPGFDVLFLSKTGGLTGLAPSKLAGDVWSVIVGRRVSDYTLIFQPQPPIRL